MKMLRHITCAVLGLCLLGGCGRSADETPPAAPAPEPPRVSSDPAPVQPPPAPPVKGEDLAIAQRWGLTHPGQIPSRLMVLRSRADAEKLQLEPNPLLNVNYTKLSVLAVWPHGYGASGCGGTPGHADILRVVKAESGIVVAATVMEPVGKGPCEAFWGPSSGEAVAVALPAGTAIKLVDQAPLSPVREKP